MALLMLRPALKKTKPVKFAQNSTLVNELARLASAGIPADQLRAAAAQLEQLRRCCARTCRKRRASRPSGCTSSPGRS